MISDFKKKKFLFVFTNYFDANSSGVIEKEDLILALDNAGHTLGWPTNSEIYQSIAFYLHKIWDIMQYSVDEKYGGVTKTAFISMMEEFYRNPSAEGDFQDLFSKMVFVCFGGNIGGSFNCEEFSKLHIAFGGNKDEAVQAFLRMSKGKPTIGWDEYRQLIKEFFTADDVNAPGNYMYGKLSY